MGATLERCYACGDWFEPHALHDERLVSGRMVLVCYECEAEWGIAETSDDEA